MQGNVTDIQRFSLNDGDGIRTTVFLKGCNMNCRWCHNPETIDFKNSILLYDRNCIGCGHCFEVCPVGAHISVDGIHQIDKEKCIGCGKCVNVCYAEALEFSAKSMSVEEVMSHIVQDKVYYSQSGGGVTFSGGEALCQLGFVDALADACNKQGIDIALETNLFHEFGRIEKTLRKFDLIMFDIKLMDNEMHKKYVGVENSLVLENALKADELGIPIIVRTPLIPNITDTDENLVAIAEFVSGLKNARFYELLNFNPLGGTKYCALRLENSFADAKPLGASKLQHIKEILKNYNFKIS
ncbi:MAG: glycyl-radical enzyme activating protein [Oscillospiraceae bacterium]|nr:glycyl-radical enzyme activating protein [Oscillospiraceae bacterium]